MILCSRYGFACKVEGNVINVPPFADVQASRLLWKKKENAIGAERFHAWSFHVVGTKRRKQLYPGQRCFVKNYCQYLFLTESYKTKC